MDVSEAKWLKAVKKRTRSLRCGSALGTPVENGTAAAKRAAVAHLQDTVGLSETGRVRIERLQVTLPPTLIQLD
jgi:hypothetical protein